MHVFCIKAQVILPSTIMQAIKHDSPFVWDPSLPDIRFAKGTELIMHMLFQP